MVSNDPPDLGRIQQDFPMLDIILIAAGCGCFALAIAYARACDRL